MVALSPWIWGYQDYLEKVPPQTRRERTLAGIYGIPLMVLGLAFPVYSVLELRGRLGGAIPFADAFIHLLILPAFSTLGYLVLLDWLIVSRVTPGFVIIPGSEAEEYKDFSHHYRGHLRAAVIMVILSTVVAMVV